MKKKLKDQNTPLTIKKMTNKPKKKIVLPIKNNLFRVFLKVKSSIYY
jgi:hypothetical protein